MNITYYPRREQEFCSLTFEETLLKEIEDTLRKEGQIKEVHQHPTLPKLLNLFPLTPDLQPSKLHKSATISGLVKATKAKQIAARRPGELVTGGLLLHIDYKPQKRHPADWQLSFPNRYDITEDYPLMFNDIKDSVFDDCVIKSVTTFRSFTTVA